MSDYIILTAALNEERHLAATIQSVRAQTRRPRQWLVADDGSRDGTAAVVERQAAECAFLRLHRRPRRDERAFSSKAEAINEAFSLVARAVPDFQYVAILDADVTLAPDYYQRVIQRFEEDPALGIAGGTVSDRVGDRYLPKRNSPHWSVCGPVQMFRRSCFEKIGGYFPSRVGGVDAIAEVMARMNGWTVRTFPDITAYHQRQTGTEGQGILRAIWKQGVQNYALGYHPLFMLARCLPRLFAPPYLVGGAVLGAGYLGAAVRGQPRQVPSEFVRYLRREQLSRLRGSAVAR